VAFPSSLRMLVLLGVLVSCQWFVLQHPAQHDKWLLLFAKRQVLVPSISCTCDS
jgi:hypothetical protein